jgi:hypothetical protein
MSVLKKPTQKALCIVFSAPPLSACLQTLVSLQRSTGETGEEGSAREAEVGKTFLKLYK